MIDKIKENYLFFRLQRKEKEAFVQFYDLYLDKIYQYIYLKVGSKEDAEDLTSDFFLKVWNLIQAGKISDYRTLKPFIYTVARNTIIDYYRRNNKNKNISLEENVFNTEDDEGIKLKDTIIDEKTNLEKVIDQEIELKVVLEKMNHLKDEYREIIILKYLHELSIEEIAEIMDKSKGNIRVLSYRAIQALKNLL